MTPILSTMNNYQKRYDGQYGAQPNFTAGNSQLQPNFSAAQTGSNTTDALVQNNPLFNAAASSQDNPASLLTGTLASFLALLGINNFVNNPLLTKNYNDTIFKKVEVWGDKIGAKEGVKNFSNKLGTLKYKFNKKVLNSEIFSTLFRKSKESLGGSMVMSQAAGSKGHLASRAMEVMKAYKEKTGFTGFDAILAKADKNAHLYYKDIIKAIKNSGADLTKDVGSRVPWSLWTIKNKMTLQEILNKDVLVQNFKGTGKTLGQKLSGYLMRGTECITNGVFGGKGQMLLQAFFIAQSLNEASKAEKGEKFSSFMASFSELMAFMATMGIQQRVVNHLAGLKYIGFTPAQVKEYKNAIKLANEAAKLGNAGRAAHAAQVAVIEGIKASAKANTKWYQKPIKMLGNLLSYGRIRETLKPLKSNAVANFFAKIPYGFKVGAGFIGRVALLMAVVIPIFSGIAKKTSCAIFGKPTKTLEREKQKELEEKQKAEQEALEAQKTAEEQTEQPAAAPVQHPQQTAQPVYPQQNQGGSLINKMVEMHNQNNPTQPIAYQPVQQQPIYQQPQYQQPMAQPSYPKYQPYPQQPIANQPITASTVSKKQEEPKNQSPEAGIKRSYIPNPILGVENTPAITPARNAAFDRVMQQANWAEAQAAKFLH